MHNLYGTTVLVAILGLAVAKPALSAPTSTDNQRLRQALSQHPKADADGDGILTLKEAVQYKRRRGAAGQKAADAVAPTFADIKYGEHERNVLDFWKAESAGPTPLVIFFHGGGFTAGDKQRIHTQDDQLKEFLPKGVSFVSVNYPFKQHVGNDLQVIMKHSQEAVKFILSKSAEWNFDSKRIAVKGASAGALISNWLAYNMDEISVMGVYAQPKGTDKMLEFGFDKTCPPIFIYQASRNDDALHHPQNAKLLEKRCDEAGVKCELWGTKENGLPQLKDIEAGQAMMKFFAHTWGFKIPQ
jgi:acetyl esterase/lipase